MKKISLSVFGITLMALAGSLNAQVTLESIDIRGNGVFGVGVDDPATGVYFNHETNVSAITLNGAALPGGSRTAADPIDIQMTYSNLDLDGDSTANDVVTFTVRWEKVDFDGDGLDGGPLATFGQGIDTGFGNLNDIQVSVVDVTGTTTDSGAPIFFDGFTGATIGAGGGVGGIDRTAEVNGTALAISAADSGAFQFMLAATDFAAPAATLMIDNSGDSDFDGMGDGGTGSVVARAYDLQFSLTPSMTPIKGDVNMDGSVTFLDISSFIAVLSTPGGFQAEADCDCDGDVDFLDIQPFIDILAGTP